MPDVSRQACNPFLASERRTFSTGLLVLGLGVGLLMLIPSFTCARESPPKDDTTASVARSKGPQAYCGVQSLYRAVRALGKDVTLTDLATPKYISSKKGSSVADLTKAGKELGISIEPMSRMTCGMLRQVRIPVILHVKPEMDSKEYNHWILYMGTVSGKAKIYDGQGPATEIRFDELTARWDGVGLLVSDSPISTTRIRLTAVGPFTLCAGLMVFTVGLLFHLERRWKGKRAKASRAGPVYGSIGQAAGLVLIALAAMAIYRVGSDVGFLSNPAAITGIQDSNFESFLPKVTIKEMARLIGTPDVAIVDARFPSDFEAGHLKGAINIQANASLEAFEMAMASVSKESRIVVYSHSNGCHFDEKVAKELIALGYQNILNLRGGWVEWEKHHPLLGKSSKIAKRDEG